jgi:hypothetical protein
LDRFSGRLVEAESRMRVLLNGGTSDPWWADCWYELGEILDRLARYDDAMEAFLEAKALVRPAVVHHAATLQRIQARLLELEVRITASVLEQWAAGAASLQPLQLFAIVAIRAPAPRRWNRCWIAPWGGHCRGDAHSPR